MIEHQAGPELDQLIAAEIMGWQMVLSDGIFYWEDIGSDEGHNGRIAQQRNQAGYLLEDVVAWSPSTRIEDAMEVAKRLIKGKRQFELRCCSLSEPVDCWQAVVDCGDVTFEQLYYAFAETAALAICRVALKVVGDD